MPELDSSVYAGLLSLGCRRTLFDLDQLLAGAVGPGYRLKPWQYDQAREAIVTLYHILKRPDLEPTPHARAAAKAKADGAFQAFMGAALRRRRGDAVQARGGVKIRRPGRAAPRKRRNGRVNARGA